jgi:hypothetical protein
VFLELHSIAALVHGGSRFYNSTGKKWGGGSLPMVLTERRNVNPVVLLSILSFVTHLLSLSLI